MFVAAAVYTSAAARVQIECQADGTCTTTSGYTPTQLARSEGANLAAAFFELWMIMVSAYLLICMGACHSRYPVRLFSITKPLSQLPVPATATTFTPLDAVAPPAANGEDEGGDVSVRDAMGNVIAPADHRAMLRPAVAARYAGR